MATVNGFTAERMLAIENGTVVSGDVVGDDLILTTKDGTPINAGNVRGPIGPAQPYSVAVAGDMVIMRTSDGRGKVATPTAPEDIATKDYVDLRLPMSSTNAPLGPISNFASSGQYILETLPTGKKRVTASNVRLTRTTSNFGTVSTSAWTALGTLIPAACRIGQAVYLNAFVSTSGGVGIQPIGVFLDFGTGAVSIRGASGLTTVINNGDLISINHVLVES